MTASIPPGATLERAELRVVGMLLGFRADQPFEESRAPLIPSAEHEAHLRKFASEIVREVLELTGQASEAHDPRGTHER